MKHDPPNRHDEDDDDLLGSAFRSVRDTYDGQNDEASLTLQRALFRTRGDVRKRKLARLSLLPIAAALVVSTAWAGMTGRLTVHVMLDLVHPETTHSSPAVQLATAPSAVLSTAPADPLPVAPPEPAASVVVASPPPVVAAPPEVAAPPVVPSSRVSSVPAATVAVIALPPPPVETVAKPETAPAASAPDPNAALFAEAHRLHFLEKDPAKALVAWDAYLKAAPDGRLAPEAHYNRALALVRLDRRTDAVSELVGFANGSWGGYRRAEAKALLDAIVNADAGP